MQVSYTVHDVGRPDAQGRVNVNFESAASQPDPAVLDGGKLQLKLATAADAAQFQPGQTYTFTIS